jgi:exopolysaccharide biosynthesis WecB/TagA/CpsF family protein
MTDYAEVTHLVLAAAQSGRPLLVTACAVHGLVSGYLDKDLGSALNTFDVVAPDGQPLRWGLRWTNQALLGDRVYGPELMVQTCQAAELHHLPVFLFGSTRETLQALKAKLLTRFPRLVLAGTQASRFRPSDKSEQEQDAETIVRSGARIVFVGLGCPRQEWWVFHQRRRVPLPMLAVGAAFDIHAGRLPQAPAWMQRRGLEWLYRLAVEPRRLWRRYLGLNSLYLLLIGLQALHLRSFPSPNDTTSASQRDCPG